MKKLVTLLLMSLFASFAMLAESTVLRPDSAYAASMYIGANGLFNLYPMLTITPAAPDTSYHIDVVNKVGADSMLVQLSEESTSATHPHAVSGPAFGAWHSAPFGKTNPVTSEEYTIAPADVWVTYVFDEAKDLDSIAIWNMHQLNWNGEGHSNNGVKDFTVEIASSADGDWTEVLSATLDAIPDADSVITAQVFALSNAKGATHIRINVDSNHGHAKNVGLAEVRFVGSVAGSSAIASLASASISVRPLGFRSVAIEGADLGAQYSVYNLTGMAVARGVVAQGMSVVDFSAPGVYVVSVTKLDKVYTQKILVK